MRLLSRPLLLKRARRPGIGPHSLHERLAAAPGPVVPATTTWGHRVPKGHHRRFFSFGEQDAVQERPRHQRRHLRHRVPGARHTILRSIDQQDS